MSDYIVRATAGNGSIRAFAATTRDLVQHAREIHHTSPVVRRCLGAIIILYLTTAHWGELNLKLIPLS